MKGREIGTEQGREVEIGQGIDQEREVGTYQGGEAEIEAGIENRNTEIARKDVNIRKVDLEAGLLTSMNAFMENKFNIL